MKIKVKCPVCKWRGEITDEDTPSCPKCLCDMVVEEALLELIDKKIKAGNCR